MDKIIEINIKKLRLRTVIGIAEWERKTKQDLIINVSLKYNASKAISEDSIDNGYNYKTLTKKIISHVESSSYQLIETLASSVLDIVKETENVFDVVVEVEKPYALRFSDNVTVTING